MRSKTGYVPNPLRLEAGTVVRVSGSVYELRFPATFYPSKDNRASGLMIDQWGSRNYIEIVESGYDKILATDSVS